jgi:hypothetical protein
MFFFFFLFLLFFKLSVGFHSFNCLCWFSFWRSENTDHFFHCEILFTSSLEEEECTAHLEKKVSEKLKSEFSGGYKKKLVINLQSTNKREVRLLCVSYSFIGFVVFCFLKLCCDIHFCFSFLIFLLVRFSCHFFILKACIEMESFLDIISASLQRKRDESGRDRKPKEKETGRILYFCCCRLIPSSF